MGDLPFRQYGQLAAFVRSHYVIRTRRHHANALRFPTGMDRWFVGTDTTLLRAERKKTWTGVTSGEFGIASTTKLAESGRMYGAKWRRSNI